ncbi:hypothetical protein SSX86_006074 [Deinandra increscens subsp. villosa]|uniref:BRCT domain-containing protein n=1 Tax=Deinandra increscens subsp. villosa TaxID=3103831 RepID=A0AAP0DRP2_9ASTR
MGDYDNDNDSDSGTWDFVGEETQIFDSQFCDSLTSSFGNKCDADTQALQSTLPFDDTVMCDYELPTQVMDPDGETQVVNLDTEFDEMDVFDETQLFNDYDTEEVVVSDHEGSEKTEIVADSEESSDEDSCRREQTQNIHHCKVDLKECKPNSDCGRSEQHTTGVGFKKFTSFRAASIRAAGLTALNKASKLSKSPSCPSLSSEPDTEHRRILFGKSNFCDLEKVKKSTDARETGNKCPFGRSTARKLFAEDPLAETKDANDNSDLSGAADSPILEAEPVGLSYIDSQEPGDASQANALDFVDNFLKVNIECDDGCNIRKSTGGKSKPVLSGKGTQSFAKGTNLISGVDKRRIFDWNNNLEDEGGGEFFRKNKELFFASGSRRLKASFTSRSGRKLGQSDSKLVLGKNEEKERHELNKNLETVRKDSSTRKNLINELDKHSTDIPGGEDIQVTVEACFDTQRAAEAMGDLCLGLQKAGHDSTKTGDGYHKSQPTPFSSNGVRTTRSRSKTSANQSKEVMQVKSAAKKSENFDNVASDVAKRTRRMTVKRREADTVEAPIAPVEQMSVKKQRIQYVAPVAQRTRQSTRYNKSEKDIIAPTGFSPKVKKSCQKLSSARKESGTQSISRLTRSKAATLTGQEKGLIRGRTKKDLSVCTTPVSRRTPVKEPSPICMGDEYLKQSYRRSSLIQEVCGLFPSRSLVESPNKDTRQKRDVSLIRVMFSRHLDGDIIKHQQKILSRLGASESSSMADATHFIADNFVRTRNMLEAIALGKPVVTHLWLESCGQACCHIDEKNFILRDAKKEKEVGFSLPASLAHARQSPLLKGRRVLITPNTKPGKEILSSLVKAVHGVLVERMGRSLWSTDKVPEGLLILSCEEDHAVCLPFLEKGAAIFSSELLLNGIVIQRLEYERHRLFLDHVKRTRSTIWVKKDDKYKAVGKVK